MRHVEFGLQAFGLALIIFQQAQAQGSNFTCTASSPNATQYNASTTYLGCWTDSTTRTLNGPQINNANMSPQYCANRCGNAGYNYSAVEYTT
jgi:beta-D-xylosidase 4